MAGELDPVKSDKARADGNTSFRKGRWTEAIGHYTNATVYNPGEPMGYSNRAAAYLKLEKYKDAEKDCTIALELAAGTIKALYRRALARKGLGRIQDATTDVREILRLESGNEVALAELEELKGLEERGKQGTNAASVPSPSRRASASIELLSSSGTGQVYPTPSPTPTPIPTPTPTPTRVEPTPREASRVLEDGPSSFASLRKSRDSRKTFVNAETSVSTLTTGPTHSHPSNLPPTRPTSSQPSPRPISTNDGEPRMSIPPARPTKPEARIPALSQSVPSPPPPDPDSPGASLILIRQLGTLPPSDAWILISSYPPLTIPRLLAPFLEPDILGKILLALNHAAPIEADEQEIVRTMMQALRATSRWKINVAMLSRIERVAGEQAWKSCGGALSDWP
ncbi:MAG: hypothetical protein TREMPRED_002939 [Tremellales sp. Tagirdzhanova-0007]|nr:MAG: hypothetical protein TREMPRED_002939 [Tremellales sp. Tagirdzhanova-0007]